MSAYSGEFLTRSTVWISIASYTIGCIVFATARGRSNLDRWTRLSWTTACAALLAHYAFAFHFHHAWSHAAAYADTARQTAEVFAINWGGGLYVNYAFAALWITDIAWWWIAGVSSYRERPWLLTIIWHSLLVFIIFNATVVFEQGFIRLIGAIISASLVLSWIAIGRHSQSKLSL